MAQSGAGLGRTVGGLTNFRYYYGRLIDSLPLPLRLFFYRNKRANFTKGEARP
jgi:hypothetical protein